MTIKNSLNIDTHPGSLAISMQGNLKIPDTKAWIEEIRQTCQDQAAFSIDKRLIEGLKFSQCLPLEIASRIIRERFVDREVIDKILNLHCREINDG